MVVLRGSVPYERGFPAWGSLLWLTVRAAPQLVTGLAGADPANLLYGETVALECVAEAGVFYLPRGTGFNTSTCMGDCSFSEAIQCVLATTCKINVTANGVGEGLFLVEGTTLAFGAVPKEERRTVVAPLGGRLFNEEALHTTCKEGFRSSASTHANGEACALDHTSTCQPTGLLAPISQNCQPVRCPAHQEVCDYEPCGADQNQASCPRAKRFPESRQSAGEGPRECVSGHDTQF